MIRQFLNNVTPEVPVRAKELGLTVQEFVTLASIIAKESRNKDEKPQNNSTYNTYIISGLPPGPIANPGLDSLRAALYPASVDSLYFVPNNDGTHQFSANFAAHNEAVSRYRNKKEKE